MKAIFAPAVFFVLGLSFGIGGTTPVWSDMLNRSQAQTKAAYVQFEQAMALAQQNLETAQSCTKTLTQMVSR